MTVLKSISIYVHNYVVQCPGLIEPMNGMISCLIVNGQTFSYEDTRTVISHVILVMN